MPFKRDRSPYWQIERNLPGYGFTGRISTRVRDQGIAKRMESLLEDLASKALVDPSWYPLLDAICKEHTVSLADALRARSTGRLLNLRRTLTDPLITEAIEAYRSVNQYDKPVWIGLDFLGRTLGASRLGELTGRRITELCAEYEMKGVKRNTVRRQLHRAISMLLRFHLGNAERDAIFAEVRYAGEDDTREVYLSAADIRRLLDTCEALGFRELGVIIRMALATSADRSVLLAGPAHNSGQTGRTYRGLLLKDIQIFKGIDERMRGIVYLEDHKTDTRSRSVPITDEMCRLLLPYLQGLASDDPVFETTYMGLDYPWRQVRQAADLMHVRFKDLRAQTAIHIEEAGIPATVAQRTLGHSSPAMTRRYLQRAVTMTAEQAERLNRSLFGDGPDEPQSAAG